jgi:hypothetical protein
MPMITDRAPLPQAPTAKVAQAPAPQAPVAAPQKQPDITEGAPASSEATPGAPDALSPKFAALARREKAIQDKDAWLKSEQKKLEDQRGEIRKQAQAELRERLRQDPFGLLSEEGLTGEQLLNLQANQPSPEAQKLTLLEQKLAQIEKDKADAQTANYQAARKQALGDISRIVQTNPDFEVIKALGLEEQVVSKLEDAYKTTGTLPDYESVCREIEEEYFPMALEIAKLAKIQKALSPPPAETAVAAPQEPASHAAATQKQAPATTLSNRQTPNSGKGLSWQERRARAIAVAQGLAV